MSGLLYFAILVTVTLPLAVVFWAIIIVLSLLIATVSKHAGRKMWNWYRNEAFPLMKWSLANHPAFRSEAWRMPTFGGRRTW